MKHATRTSADVIALLTGAVGDVRVLSSYVEVIKEKDKPTVLVKSKQHIPSMTWHIMNKAVHEWGGKWHPKERLWEVPLNG